VHRLPAWDAQMLAAHSRYVTASHANLAKAPSPPSCRCAAARRFGVDLDAGRSDRIGQPGDCCTIRLSGNGRPHRQHYEGIRGVDNEAIEKRGAPAAATAMLGRLLVMMPRF
jgi:hypothetical protein